MKKWECDVCGFIHEGENPPEKCPVCDSPSKAFALMLEAEKEPETKAAGGRRWRCVVCGYIHEGNEPPERCPVCAAPRNMFVEIDAEGKDIGTPPQPEKVEPAAPILKPAAPATAPPPGRFAFLNRFAELSSSLHLHPIMAHFPNGVLPVFLVFLGISMFFRNPTLEAAAYYNLIFVLLTLPIVILTGFLEWQRRYKGAKTALFITKILAALTVLCTANVLVFWRYLDPAVTAPGSPNRYIYLGVAAAMLAAAGVAGYIGGRLIFGTRR